MALDVEAGKVEARGQQYGEIPTLVIGRELVQLQQAAIVVAKLQAGAQSPALTGEEIIHLRQTQDIISIATARRAGSFAASGEAQHQGSNTAMDWIRHQAKMSTTAAAELEVVGRHLDQLPQAVEAVMEGRIGFGHLAHMARNAAFSAKSRRGAFDEVPLLPHAESESVGRFAHTCIDARHAQDPEGCKQSEANAFEQRELKINPVRDEGLTWINILLDDANAAFTQSVLEQMARRRGPEDTRTKTQRMADAFLELTHAPLHEREGGDVVGSKVNINVTCTLETLMGLKGAQAAWIDFGRPISAELLRMLACDSTITKILLDDKLMPVAVGHMKRQLTKKERRALNARDQHCQFPGCNRPPAFCSEHHLDEWASSHTTKLSRMVLLCAMHHWRVHLGGWLLGKGEDDQVYVVPPYLRHLARGPGGGAPA